MMENALVRSGRLAQHAGRRSGVLIRALWGDRRLVSEFVPFGKPRSFTVGLEEGCDFAAPGLRRFELVQVHGDGAVVRFTKKMAGERRGPEGGTPLEALCERGEASADGEAHALELEGRDVVRVELGPLSFEVFKLSAPPVERKGFFDDVDFTWANLLLALVALGGVFILYAANREAEGAPLADDLSQEQLRLIKVLERVQPPRLAAAPEAVGKPAKEGKRVGAPQPHQTPRPNTADKPGRADLKQLVAKMFAASGHGVFSPGGLGEELEKNVGGIVGAGLQGSGLGLKDDGSGFGGTTVGIGSIGVHGHGGHYGPSATATDCGMNCKEHHGPEIQSDPPVVSCGSPGGGCMDKDLIRRVIHANIAKFRFCYESRLNENPKLAGKVSVRFSIDPSGRVSTSSLAQSTVGDPVLDACVVGRTRLLNFPSRKSDGLVLVTYPFVFHAGAQ